MAAVVLVHLCFWGAGLALVTTPWRWRKFWPAMMVPLGWALQSWTVWIGLANVLEGIGGSVWASEVVPAALLGIGLWRRGCRAAWRDLGRFGLVGLLVLGVSIVAIVPLRIASQELNTISLGSAEPLAVVSQAEAWLKAREFGGESGTGGGTSERDSFIPPVLVAWHASLLERTPAELGSVMTMVIFAAGLTQVFWAARAILGYSGGVTLVISLLFGVNPVVWHMAGHGASSLLLAGQGIVLVTWSGMSLARGRMTWRRVAEFSGVLAAGFWLVMGNDRLATAVCLLPSLTYVAGLVAWRRMKAKKLGAWCGVMLGAFAAVATVHGTVLPELIHGWTEAESWQAGRHVPVLFPEGWLGMVTGPRLQPWSWFGLNWVLELGAGVAFSWAMWRAVRQGRTGAWVVASIVLPVLAVYVWLESRSRGSVPQLLGAGYVFLAVMYPLLLPAMCWWVTLRRSRKLTEWFGVVGVMGLVVAFNVVGTAFYVYHLAQPPVVFEPHVPVRREQ